MPVLPVELNLSKTRAQTIVPDWLKEKVRRRIAELVELTRTRLRRTIPMPTVGFDLRGRVAGRAYCGRRHVQFNPVLLVENVQPFLTDTIPHELAHLVAYELYGGSIEPHGSEWARIMTQVFGIPANRCHQLDTSRSVVADVLYRYACRCPGRTHELTVRRHNTMQKGGAYYVCKDCGARLRYAGVRDMVAERAAAPTPAQVAYAGLLADKAGVPVPDEVRRDKTACRRFIEAHREAESPPTPAAPPANAAPASLPPTEKQLAFAQRLAIRAGVAIPPAVLNDRRLLSRWIDAQLT